MLGPFNDEIVVGTRRLSFDVWNDLSWQNRITPAYGHFNGGFRWKLLFCETCGRPTRMAPRGLEEE
jgi:hypothetical protein